MSDFINFTDRVRYRKENFKSTIIGSSDCNEYIPFYSLFAHEYITFKDTDIGILEYSLPIIVNRSNYMRTYNDLIQALKYIGTPYLYLFKSVGNDYEIGVFRGSLFLGDELFMCLAINTEYVLNTPRDVVTTTPDYSKFTLFINNSFVERAEYKNVNKKLDSLYIQPLKDLGIDVVYTSRIKEWVFKNNFNPPKFKSVKEMTKHLKEEVVKMI